MSSLLSRLLHFGFALAMPMSAMACVDTTENDAPIIDSVDAPLVVRERDGAYAIRVTVLFHDNDGEAITHLRYRLWPNIDGIIDVPAPNPTRESAEVTIVIRASDLDGELSSPQGDGVEKDRDDAKGYGDAKHARESSRSRARALQLSIVDRRGAESLPQTSPVTLD